MCGFSRYGDVMTVYLGSRCTVMLNSYDAIKEAFLKQGHVFAGRPQDLFFVSEITEGLGIDFMLFDLSCDENINIDCGVCIPFSDDELRFVQKVHPARANAHCLCGRNCNPLLLHYHILQLYFICNHLILNVFNHA